MAKEQLLLKVDNQELINLIEGLHYETEARKDIITFYLTNDMKASDSFKEYNKEYREFFVQYSEAKTQLEDLYIKKNPELDGRAYTRWNLDFATGNLTVDLA